MSLASGAGGDPDPRKVVQFAAWVCWRIGVLKEAPRKSGALDNRVAECDREPGGDPDSLGRLSSLLCIVRRRAKRCHDARCRQSFDMLQHPLLMTDANVADC